MNKILATWLTLLTAAICATAISAQALEDQAEYDAAFEARSASLLHHLMERVEAKAEARRTRLTDEDHRPANVMTTTADRIDLLEAALLITSGKDVETGNAVLQEEAASPFRGGMFYIHDMMGAYHYAGDGVLPETRRAVRESMKRVPIYRGDTENHWVLYYTGLYLAAQTWPGEPDTSWFNGKSSMENMQDAREFLEHWMDLTTTIGQGEFDSPTYFVVFVSPMLTIFEFCEDPELKAKARKMVDWILADYAAEYLEGVYAGGHSRDYSYDATAPEKAPAAGWGWLFFGDAEPVYRSDNLLAAWSTYRLPVVIHNVAVDRSSPYEHFERKRVRHIMRYGDEMNPPVFKTTYMASTYALGSIQGGILQPIQQHTWDVSYVGDEPNRSIFTLHPYYSGYELAMFFPEEIEWLSDEVDRYHLVYTDPNKWNSSSPYERTFQHKNAIIVLYDIPPEGRHQHIDGFFPKSLHRRDLDDSGWIFCDAGQTFVGVYPLQPVEWIEEDINWRMRSHEGRNGAVVEVATAAEYPSFAAFQERVRTNKLDVSRFKGNGEVDYTTSGGDVMHFQYPDERWLNGRPIDLSQMPLFKGPHLNGNGDEQRLVVTHGAMSYVIDLGD